MNIILGTAQFGLNYGILNKKGKIPKKISIELLKYSIENGISTFDTAPLYGDSENILGQYSNYNLNIITKIKNIKNFNDIDESLIQSQKNLNTKKIYMVLLHSYDDYLKNNNQYWEYLIKNNNISENFGVSVYTVSEAIECLKNNSVKCIQIPFNIIDRQWYNHNFLNLINKRKDVKIHCRSIFLQGLLLSDNYLEFPDINNDKKLYAKNIIRIIDNLMIILRFKNKMELCVSYVKSFEWIDSLIFGVDNLKHLKLNLDATNIRKLNNSELELFKFFEFVPNKLLNPSNWYKL